MARATIEEVELSSEIVVGMTGLLNPKSSGKKINNRAFFQGMLLVVWLGHEIFHAVAVPFFLRLLTLGGLNLPK